MRTDKSNKPWKVTIIKFLSETMRQLWPLVKFFALVYTLEEFKNIYLWIRNGIIFVHGLCRIDTVGWSRGLGSH